MNKKINIFVVFALLTFLVVDASGEDGRPRNLPSTDAMRFMRRATGLDPQGKEVEKAPSPSPEFRAKMASAAMGQSPSFLKVDTGGSPRVNNDAGGTAEENDRGLPE